MVQVEREKHLIEELSVVETRPPSHVQGVFLMEFHREDQSENRSIDPSREFVKTVIGQGGAAAAGGGG